MYNYCYRQDTMPTSTLPTPDLSSEIEMPFTLIPAQPDAQIQETDSETEMPSEVEIPISTVMPSTTEMPSTLMPTQPYAQMQEIITDVVELYHRELMNLKSYETLLELSPNLQDEELVQDIVNHTNQNIFYLEQIYLGLTGDVIDRLPLGNRITNQMSYSDLLKNTLFAKLDTLEQYELIYRMIPVQPYKDVLLNTLICQLKDAATCNYLITTQPMM